MKNIFGFQVHINGEHICRAGFEKENSVVTCILTSVRRENSIPEELDISIAGLNSETKQHVSWHKKQLEVGDRITLEVISDNFDAPTSIREPKSEKDIIARKMKQYNRLKEELKEYL
ncbi:hypothetical protein [Polaribacter sp.]|uniref:hypothetical protein n=1 Tax=Polaribacter sp. TaxID=1920175 RepID=UPI003F6A3C81